MADVADRALEAEERFRERALAEQARRAPRGIAAAECEDCGEPIPPERRRAMPGCVTCVDCQELRERSK